MSTTGDKDLAKVAKEGYDRFSKDDLNGVAQVFSENSVFTVMPTGEVLRGRQAILGYIGNFKTAFPDMKIDINRQIACGDQVVTEFVGKGTHTGMFKTPMGDLAPTKRKVEVPVCEVTQIRNGQVQETRQYLDTALLMSQLGVINLAEEHRSY